MPAECKTLLRICTRRGGEFGMARSIQSIQSDIANVAREIQELRRTQRRVSADDPPPTGKRIYELARALDTLFAEKRSVHAPSAPLSQVSERRRAARRHRKAAEDLIARLFGSKSR